MSASAPGREKEMAMKKSAIFPIPSTPTTKGLVETLSFMIPGAQSLQAAMVVGSATAVSAVQGPLFPCQLGPEGGPLS